MSLDLLLNHFETIADAPGGVARLRQLILQLAVQGRLVVQDPADEPASVLLERIRAEKARLVKEGLLKKIDPATSIATDEQPFEVPPGWKWVTLTALGLVNPRNNIIDNTEVSFVPMTWFLKLMASLCSRRFVSGRTSKKVSHILLKTMSFWPKLLRASRTEKPQ